MMASRGALSELVDQARNGPFVRLVVVSTEGSAPREIGAAMIVAIDATTGTIGGGRLEFEAIAHARKLLAQANAESGDWLRDLRAWPLGPALGQCCGGSVRVLFEHYGPQEREHLSALATERATDGDVCGMLVHPIYSGKPVAIAGLTYADASALAPPIAAILDDMSGGQCIMEPVFVDGSDKSGAHFIEPTGSQDVPLFIYGAGHVGRAIVKIASDLEFETHWVDTHEERFPENLPAGVKRVVARDPATIAHAAPQGAFHVVLTYSHAMDLAICHALLARQVCGFLGLIGSQTKRARFRKRLRDAGLSHAALDSLTCPIGVTGLRGKQPATVAVSIVAQLIERLEAKRDADLPTAEREHGPGQRISA